MNKMHCILLNVHKNRYRKCVSISKVIRCILLIFLSKVIWKCVEMAEEFKADGFAERSYGEIPDDMEVVDIVLVHQQWRKKEPVCQFGTIRI